MASLGLLRAVLFRWADSDANMIGHVAFDAWDAVINGAAQDLSFSATETLDKDC